MKLFNRYFVSLLVCCLINLISAASVHAFYDPRTVPNNKVGVHILNPSEIEDAAKLVDSEGGDWGYVTIPIQPSDRDKDKWQTFMHDCTRLHLIPIIRITTIPAGGTWDTGEDTDLVDFANFLNGLDWPIENRYIVLFNEVNRAAEWGGTVDPEKYASIVKNAHIIFKERSENFFLLGPALDESLPNSTTSLAATTYLQKMSVADPLVWTYFDGWAAHSYPNPGFTAPARKTGLQSIVSYKSDFALLKLVPKPVFITETGWDQSKVNPAILSTYWNTAWNIWGSDENVVAVTPFVLRGGDQFSTFSLYDNNGNRTNSGNAIATLAKLPGSPHLGTVAAAATPNLTPTEPNWTLPFFKNSRALLKLENIFRVVMGLPIKGTITLGTHNLSVELAENSSQWEKGLSDRDNLNDEDGMLFIFPEYHVPIFWMKAMRFPIDIIWIAGNTVVDITPSAPVPTTDKLPTYSPKVPVNMVLEVPSGWATNNSITVGTNLTITSQ